MSLLYGGLGLGFDKPLAPKVESTNTNNGSNVGSSGTSAPSTLASEPEKPKEEEKKKGWVPASVQLMGAHLQRKKAELAAKLNAAKPKPSVALNQPLVKKTIIIDETTQSSSEVHASSFGALPPIIVGPQSEDEPYFDVAALQNLVNEYDPKKPNDYDFELAKAGKAPEKDAELKKFSKNKAMIAPPSALRDDERDSRSRSRSRSRSPVRRPRSRSRSPKRSPSPPSFSMGRSYNGNEMQFRRSPSPPSFSTNGYSLPPSQPPQGDEKVKQEVMSLSGEEVFLRRARLAPTAAPSLPVSNPPPQPPPSSSKNKLNFITSLNSDSSISDSRVVLLSNLVGPGEVDDDLKPETIEECKKFGPVINCVIYELPTNSVPAHEAVRIFVEFNTLASAQKAVAAMNGRFFGGRSVKASLYDYVKYQHRQYT